MFKKIYHFYREGFHNMSKTSKTLWIIVLVKLFIMFVVLKIFFFPNFLNSKFDTKEEKAEYVREQLIMNNEQ
jgi:Na+/H+ antiporter NhaD/arsenite permease-like protein